jgi:hypothetical protein
MGPCLPFFCGQADGVPYASDQDGMDIVGENDFAFSLSRCLVEAVGGTRRVSSFLSSAALRVKSKIKILGQHGWDAVCCACLLLGSVGWCCA